MRTQLQSRRFPPKLTSLFAVLTASIVVGVVAAVLAITHAQSTSSVTTDSSTYYRLKVKLAYKGEPQDFDIVVGCNVREIFYKEGGSTYEAGLIPSVFGRRMSDGKGLVVRPPRACRGETTANGQVEPDLLPVIVVYDNADTLDFGIAYLSEDAYESPLSVLKFGGASIEAATRTDFDKFRREQANLVTRRVYWTGKAATETLKRLGITPAAKPFAGLCQAYERFLIPEQARPLVRQSWPSAKPRYWVPETPDDSHRYGAQGDIDRAIRGSNLLRSDSVDDPPHDPRSIGPIPEAEADYGMPTRRGGGLVNVFAKNRTIRHPGAYYPAASDFRSDTWPADRSGWAAYVKAHGTFADADIDFRGGLTRGFAYCFAMREGMLDNEWREIVRRGGVVARVDGQDLVSSRAPWSGASSPFLILERDEYMFLVLRVGLGSPRGDV